MSTAPGRDATADWDVASPGPSGRLPGVTMAGFGVRRFAGPLRLVPHPGLTLLLEFGAGRPVVDDPVGVRQQGSMVAGLGFGFGGVVSARGEDVECVQVRLAPVVAQQVLGVSPAELSGTMVDLDDVWGRETERLRDRLSALATWPARFAAMETFLARRRAPTPAVDPETEWAWSRIVARRGRLRIDRLAADVGWSRKRLWSRFRAQLGIQPKLAATLVRFDHAVHRLVGGEAAALVAAEAGYHDQAHLHRDVVSFAGVTPSGVIDEPFLTVDDLAWPGGPDGGRSQL